MSPKWSLNIKNVYMPLEMIVGPKEKREKIVQFTSVALSKMTTGQLLQTATLARDVVHIYS